MANEGGQNTVFHLAVQCSWFPYTKHYDILVYWGSCYFPFKLQLTFITIYAPCYTYRQRQGDRLDPLSIIHLVLKLVLQSKQVATIAQRLQSQQMDAIGKLSYNSSELYKTLYIAVHIHRLISIDLVSDYDILFGTDIPYIFLEDLGPVSATIRLSKSYHGNAHTVGMLKIISPQFWTKYDNRSQNQTHISGVILHVDFGVTGIIYKQRQFSHHHRLSKHTVVVSGIIDAVNENNMASLNNETLPIHTWLVKRLHYSSAVVVDQSTMYL